MKKGIFNASLSLLLQRYPPLIHSTNKNKRKTVYIVNKSVETSEFTSEARWFTICRPFNHSSLHAKRNLVFRLFRLPPPVTRIFYVDYRGATLPRFEGNVRNISIQIEYFRPESFDLSLTMALRTRGAPGECFPRGKRGRTFEPPLSLANNFKYLSIYEYFGLSKRRKFEDWGGKEEWLIGKRTGDIFDFEKRERFVHLKSINISCLSIFNFFPGENSFIKNSIGLKKIQ